MIELKIKIDDAEVMAAMRRLAASGSSMRPAMREIGEYMVDSTRRRFAAGQAPDGTRWKSNTEATMLSYLARRGGGTSRRPGEKGRNPYFRKDGRLNKRGGGLLSGKKPLIGESKRLSSEIHYRAGAGSVEVGSSMEYAAVQQFGAGRGDFGSTKRGAPIPWGDIPARPFLGLSETDKSAVLDILHEHIEAALGR
jgi:phage gpG-like protein